MTTCAVGMTSQSRAASRTHAHTHTCAVKRLCSGHEASDPALQLPRQPIYKHQNNDPLPSCAYFEMLCRSCNNS
jgi:hypothetical protein